VPLNEQSKQWLRDRKQTKPKGIKANSQEYKDGWERIFGGNKDHGKTQDLQEGSDSKDTNEA